MIKFICFTFVDSNLLLASNISTVIVLYNKIYVKYTPLLKLVLQIPLFFDCIVFPNGNVC